MQSTIRRLVVIFIFVGTLIGVAIANRSYEAVTLGNYGFHLTEVSRDAGIDFVHEPPVLDSKLAHIMPEVAAMGASVSICDFDHDGLPDIYVCNSAVGSQNHLYKNLGNGRFVDVAPKMGIADVNKAGTGVSMGAVWGDYDNDGYDDLLIYKWGGGPMLLHNDHGKGFTDVSEKTGMPKGMFNMNSATWVDYDCDGHLDLLLCGYFPDNVDLWHLKNTQMMPDSFEYADNGGRKFLLRNRGDGTFEDVTEKAGINSHRWTLAVGAADLGGTGYPDLVLANDYGVTELYENHGGKAFEEIGKHTPLGQHPKSGMNCSFGDVTNDGQLDIYVSNITEPGNLLQYNNLWVPSGSGSSLTYTNDAEDAGVDQGGWSFGAQFGDLNNSGSLDLVLTNGYISADREKTYWYDFSKIAGGFGALIADAHNWPAIGNKSLGGYQRKRIWLNDGYGKFKDVAQAVGYSDTHDGRAVALGDLWNNGALDMVVSNQRGPLLLYKNDVDPDNKWVEFDLAGTRSNRSAIGASVTLYWKNSKGQELEQLQENACASGFCAQNDHRIHFGIGKGSTLEKAVIRWPFAGSAPQTLTGLASDKVISVKEPSI